jgi:TolB protein
MPQRVILLVLLLLVLPLTKPPERQATAQTTFLPLVRASLAYRIAYVGVTNSSFAQQLLLASDASATPVALTTSGDVYAPTWSPDGNSIAYISFSFTDTANTITILPLNGNKPTMLHPQPPPNLDGLAWSPDGTRFAYGVGGDLYVINSDGTDLRQVVHTTRSVQSPSWSPDSEWIAFAAYDQRPSYLDIAVVRADGTQRTTLSPGFGGFDNKAPAWSPNGELIAFSSAGQLALMQSDGTNPRVILSRVASTITQPSWSPNGAHIAFSAGTSGYRNWGISMVTLDGTRITSISECCSNFSPAWAPR